MANQLGTAEQQAILVLRRRGWSQRRIARELGVHRETVARYVRLTTEAVHAPTGSPPGGGPDDRARLFDEADPPTPAISITGSGEPGVGAKPAGPETGSSKPAISITGFAGRSEPVLIAITPHR